MRFAFIRHARTAGNLRHEYAGKSDLPLCPEAARELAEQGGFPPVARVFSSPRLRCLQTAEILYPRQDAVIIEALHERDFGCFEGLTAEEAARLPGCEGRGDNEQGMTFPGGEEIEVFRQRMMDAFLACVRNMREEEAEDAAIICHAGNIMAILEQIVLPRRTYFAWKCRNGEGYLIRYDPKTGTAAVIEALPAVKPRRL